MLSLLLLIILGFNGAVYLVLGEFLTMQGYFGFVSAFLHALGSALSLLLAGWIIGALPVWSARCFRYYSICAFLGLIGPAVATFWVIPHIGTGLMAAVIATSPIITVLISHLFGAERFNQLLFLGVMTGFVGAAVIILGEATWPSEEGKYLWLVASLLVPTLLASGNVARTALWPAGLTPIQAGAGISTFAVVTAAFLVPVFEPAAFSAMPSRDALLLMLGFVVVNGISAFPFFYLQKIGGPTLLSLLSHVMAGFGLLLGVIFFADRYRLIDLAGVLLILMGVSITSYFKRAWFRRNSVPLRKANTTRKSLGRIG